METRKWGLYLDGQLLETFSEAEYSHYEIIQQLEFALDASGEMHELRLVRPGDVSIDQMPTRKATETPRCIAPPEGRCTQNEEGTEHAE